MSSFRRDSEMQITVHLRTLSSGRPHPAAQCPTILYSRRGANVYDIPFVSVTGSRLAVRMSVQRGTWVVIWDWKSGHILFVRQPFCA